MRLTPWEEERLLVFMAAELARRHRAAGLPLNAPEAIALICDAMFEAARGGADYAAVEAAGRSAVTRADVMPGVRELVDEVRLEVLLGDGTRLIVLLDPIAGYFVANFRGRVAVSRRASIVAQVSNLFNNVYATFGLLGEADDVLGDEYDDPRFLSPAAPRSAWIGIELSLR